jgi:hypothetical protein
LGALVLDHASQFGACAQQKNSLPQLTAHWYYQQDVDGCRIYPVGDHVIQLQAFLTAAFGPPSETNGIAGRCYWDHVGADLSLSREISNGGKETVISVFVARRKG